MDQVPMPTPTPISQKQSPLLLILLTILILLLGGSTSYLAYQNIQLQKQVAQLGEARPFPTVPSPTPNPTANWKTYQITGEPTLGLTSYQIKLPASWVQIEHSSNFQNNETFQDSRTNFIYQLVIHQEKNLNPQTGRPYATLRELTGFPYDVTTLSVAGQPSAQVLPRAGSEFIYKVLFFSKDNKLVLSIELNTPQDGSKIQEGSTLFDQILSTFKFLYQGMEIDQINAAVINYLVSQGQTRSQITITEDKVLGNYKDKYIVSWNTGGPGGNITIIGKVNGQWIVPDDTTRCLWIKNSGLDQATKSYLGPTCNF